MNIILENVSKTEDGSVCGRKMRAMTVQYVRAISKNSILCQINQDTVVVISGLQNCGTSEGVIRQMADQNFFHFQSTPTEIIHGRFPIIENGYAYRRIQQFLSKYDAEFKDMDYENINIVVPCCHY